METFDAGVQYNDFKGSVAADQADMKGLAEDLKAKGLVAQGLFLVGIELSSFERSGASMRAFFVDHKDFDTVKEYVQAASPIEVTAISFDWDYETFFSYFKRFNLTMTRRGLDLAGREFRII